MAFNDDYRLRKIRVGIDGYTDSEFVLDAVGYSNVKGKIGINSTPTEGSVELYVGGDGFFTGVVTATTFFAGPTEITGGAFADELTVTSLKVNGFTTFRNDVEFQNNAKLGIGSAPTDTSPELYVDGDGFFTGVVTAVSFSGDGSGLTAVTASPAGSDGQVQYNNNGFTGGASGLYYDDTNNRLGVGNSNPTAKLDVTGQTELDDVNVSGVITATRFDGSADGRFTGLSSNFNAAIGIQSASGFIGAGFTIVNFIGVGLSIQASTSPSDSTIADIEIIRVSGADVADFATTSGIATNVIGGIASVTTLDVSGVSTFAGAADFNGDVDIAGHTELDDVNVSGAITATTFTGDLDGNAGTATSLATARTIALTGDVVATATPFDGTSNISIAATIQPNSVALGDDTTGNYVATIAGTANEITVTGSGSETAAVTLSLPDDVTIGQDLTVTRNLDVSGNVTIAGTLTYEDVTNIDSIGLVTARSGLDVTGVSTFAGAIDANGDVDIAGHTELDDVNVSGVSTFAGAIDANGDLDVDGHTELDNLRVSGVSTFQDNVNLGDNDRLRFGDSNDLEIYHDSSNSYITDSGSGNLLIGSDNDLWITNAAGTENKARFTTNGGVNLYYDNSKKFEITGAGVTVFGTTESQQLVLSGVSTFNSDVHIPNGDIGIGTDTNLTAKLTVGNIQNTGVTNKGATAFKTLNSSGGVGEAAIYLEEQSGSEGWYLKVNSSGDLQFNDSGASDRITFQDGGNIGIGTDDPQRLLHLASTNPRIRIDDTDSGGYYTELRQGGSATYLHLDGGNVGSGNFRITTDGGSEIFRFNDKGNVTIEGSTTSFDANPTIDGLQLYYETDTRLATIASYDGTSGSEISIGTNDGTGDVVEAIRIDSSGNVGINSNAPTAKLDVNGTLNVTGVSTFKDNIHLLDDDRLQIGGSVGTVDGLEIYHDGSNSYINESGTGGLQVRTSALILRSNVGENMAFAYSNGAVQLFHNNSQKFATTTTGIDVTGLTDTDTLNVSSTSTFAGAIDANGDLDVDGHTELDDLNVSGVSTFSSNVAVTANVGIGTTTNDYYLEVGPVGASGTSLLVNGDLYVAGIITSQNTIEHKILDDISSSFNGSTTEFTLASGGDNFINSEILTPARLMISVGGIVQQPDLNNQKGYNITGGTNRTTDPLKINFAEAPKLGEAFFGVAYGLQIEKQDAYITYNDSLVNAIVFGV